MSDATGATTTVMFVEFSQLSLLAGREGGGREREFSLCVSLSRPPWRWDSTDFNMTVRCAENAELEKDFPHEHYKMVSKVPL